MPGDRAHPHRHTSHPSYPQLGRHVPLELWVGLVCWSGLPADFLPAPGSAARDQGTETSTEQTWCLWDSELGHTGGAVTQLQCDSHRQSPLLLTSGRSFFLAPKDIWSQHPQGRAHLPPGGREQAGSACGGQPRGGAAPRAPHTAQRRAPALGYLLLS